MPTRALGGWRSEQGTRACTLSFSGAGTYCSGCQATLATQARKALGGETASPQLLLVWKGNGRVPQTRTGLCAITKKSTSTFTLQCAVSVRVPQSFSDEQGMASPHSTAASAAKSAAQELVAELAEAKSRIESFVESNEVALQQAVDEHERVMRGLEGARFAWRFTTPIHAAPAPAPGRAHATP